MAREIVAPKAQAQARTAPAPTRQDLDRTAKSAERAAISQLPGMARDRSDVVEAMRGIARSMAEAAERAARANPDAKDVRQNAERAAREAGRKALDAIPGIAPYEQMLNTAKALAEAAKETAKTAVQNTINAIKTAAKEVKGEITRTVGDLAERDPETAREVARVVGNLADRDPDAAKEVARNIADLHDRDPELAKAVTRVVGDMFDRNPEAAKEVTRTVGNLAERDPEAARAMISPITVQQARMAILSPQPWTTPEPEEFVGPLQREAQLPGRDIELVTPLYDRDPTGKTDRGIIQGVSTPAQQVASRFGVMQDPAIDFDFQSFLGIPGAREVARGPAVTTYDDPNFDIARGPAVRTAPAALGPGTPTAVSTPSPAAPGVPGTPPAAPSGLGAIAAALEAGGNQRITIGQAMQQQPTQQAAQSARELQDLSAILGIPAMLLASMTPNALKALILKTLRDNNVSMAA
jgi:hypothetical protein